MGLEEGNGNEIGSGCRFIIRVKVDNGRGLASIECDFASKKFDFAAVEGTVSFKRWVWSNSQEGSGREMFCRDGVYCAFANWSWM